MKICIAPYAREIKGTINPKNYIYFNELIVLLMEKYEGVHITQIGREGEEILQGVNEVCQDIAIKDLPEKLKEFDHIITVDSMIQHLCWDLGIKCICIFTQSDPLIYGHEENINILKGREYLTPQQYDAWKYVQPDADAHIDPREITAQLII